MIGGVLENQFLRFCLVGGIGFLLDAGILMLLVLTVDANLYVARAISYLFAATGTWFLNRRFTFVSQESTGLRRQWGYYVVLNAIGGAVNYGAYALSVFMSDTVESWPALGVAIGSGIGLIVNFSVNKRWVFRAT